MYAFYLIIAGGNNMKTKGKKIVFFVLMDIICIITSFFIALLLRFDGSIPYPYIEYFYTNIINILIVKILVFYFLNMYNVIWEYASIDELMKVALAAILANLLTGVSLYFINQTMPIGILVTILILDVILIGGIRFLFRISNRFRNSINNNGFKKVILVGAGASGAMILKEIRNNKDLKLKPVAFIDDNPEKLGNIINGIQVVGNRNNIVSVVDEYNIDEIIITMPSAKLKDRKEILHQCKNIKVRTRILPGIYELIDSKVNVEDIRDVQIEDLLGRDVVKLDIDGISEFIKSKVVMVTGGGGCIGSELCRQIIEFKPKELVAIDIYENNLFDLQQELLHNGINIKFTPIIASVRDKDRMDEIMKCKKPSIIFHAAAHKHVPLMEDNPKAAIKNNIFGTLNIVQAADKHGVGKFVLISTDKAVNPTSVMGATKRIAEMIIQSYNSISKTDYVAVRFGNVLGSSGSVIPLFKKQIAKGGPVTVTDERIIRYFMTIREACNLVLDAGAMARGGEIFVLNMGEPVKIIDLARDLIRLSGFEPDVDIPIKIIGLRPGEKMYEELLVDSNTMDKTKNEEIYVERLNDIDFHYLSFALEQLKKSLISDEIMHIKASLSNIVPSYKPYNGVQEIVELKEA